ncbi:hypothetical protein P280DRAFT_407103 [Massarina eburnea CBS 473.64]|uniref:Dolichyl-diphosphooligosaccharide-protein glycosyltransferase subunit OST5 n=1 Tax=Massarina eburnea CBS 473.64 TaxID=1395130 RepID=A0A6A6RQF1_9PLEO|nr:hypothetical protein P280DRAFT_407103 [Massarina eburnea CBS 473.64]
MSTPLLDVWEAAAAEPFRPYISKDSEFFFAFSLLLFSLLLTGVFSLNRSFINLPLLGVPASIAFGFGSVLMICAVGVYV